MENTLAVSYYLKALDTYPWDLPETLEAIHYALSYDDEFSEAYALMGTIQAEQFRKYEEAKYFYNTALSYDLENTAALEGLMNLAVLFKDKSMLDKISTRLKTIIGANLPNIYFQYFRFYEISKDFVKAKKHIKKAIKHSLNWDDLEFYKRELKRIKEKMK